jgi:hypothetical protein
VTFDEDGECRWATHSEIGASAIQAIAGDLGAASGEGCNTGSSGVIGVRLFENPVLDVRMRASSTATSLTAHRIMVGMHNGATALDVLTEPGTGVYFRKGTNSSTWDAVVRNNSTETSTNTGIAVSTSTLQNLRIELASTTSAIANFYINGTLVAERQNGLVPTGTAMGWSITNGTATTTPRTVIIDWIKFWHDDPPGMPPKIATPEPQAVFNPVSEGALAEYYRVDDRLTLPGTVMRLKDPRGDTEGRLAVAEPTETASDPLTLGIVSSDSPKITLGNGLGADYALEIAIAGRAPVRVTTHDGRDPIYPGDYLASSEIPGVAMKAARAGLVIGMAMDSYELGEEGTVLASISRMFYDGSRVSQASSAAATVSIPDGGPMDRFSSFVAGALESLGNFAAGIFHATAGIVTDLFTERLTVLPGGSITLPAGANEVSGENVLLAGMSEIFVPNARVTESSKIFLSPTSAATAPIAVTKKVSGQGFGVRIGAPQQADVSFDWLVIQTYDTGGAIPATSPSFATAPTPEGAPARSPSDPTPSTSTNDLSVPQSETPIDSPASDTGDVPPPLEDVPQEPEGSVEPLPQAEPPPTESPPSEPVAESPPQEPLQPTT